MAEFCGLHGQEEGEGELHEQQDTGEHSKLMFGFFMRVKEKGIAILFTSIVLL